MKNHIYVLSRSEFKEQLKTITVQQFMAGAFISIHEPENEDFPIILEESGNVLNLWFDDAEEDLPLLNGRRLQLFDQEMANQVREFVENNLNAKFWMLHCTMGKSRSGAVGEVLSEYFGIDYFRFKQDNPKVQPNTLVKNILRQEFYL